MNKQEVSAEKKAVLEAFKQNDKAKITTALKKYWNTKEVSQTAFDLAKEVFS